MAWRYSLWPCMNIMTLSLFEIFCLHYDQVRIPQIFPAALTFLLSHVTVFSFAQVYKLCADFFFELKIILAAWVTVVCYLERSLLNQVCFSLIQSDLKVKSVNRHYPQAPGRHTISSSLLLGTFVSFRLFLCGSFWTLPCLNFNSFQRCIIFIIHNLILSYSEHVVIGKNR